MRKKLLSIALSLICGFGYAETEQPPFEVKDPAVTENFREAYYAIDNLRSNFLPLSGGTMSGDIAMGGNSLTGLATGSAASPGLSFSGDAGTGIYRFGSSQIGITLGGTLSALFSSSGIRVPNGTAADPSISFLNDTDTGLFIDANRIALTFGGNARVNATGSGGSLSGGWEINGSFLPGGDDTFKLGQSGQRWDEVWAANGTIQTSSSNKKRKVREIVYGDDGFSVRPLNELVADIPVAVSSQPLTVPRGIIFRWKDKEGKVADLDMLGFFGDDLPIEARAIRDDGSRDPENYYTSAIIGILCATVRGQREQINDLSERISKLEGR